MKSLLFAGILLLVCFGGLSAAGSGGDIKPPVLVAAAANLYQIDTANSAQTVTYTLHITDDLSGVVRVQVDLKHEHGYNSTRLCFVSVEPSTEMDVACPVSFPRYSAEGRWLVVWYGLTDDVGNSSGRQVADCVGGWVDDRCTQYEYRADVPDVVRSMEIVVGPSAPGTDPPVYLPLLAR